ncbi:UNVERIFIED_CONTAM: Zn-dependent metalloprotease [Brevibacillus sp. OAP136]
MKKVVSKIMAAAIVLTALAPTASSFAATNDTTTTTQAKAAHQKFGQTAEDRKANQEELLKIIAKYSPDLTEDFQAIFEKMDSLKDRKGPKLDDATKQKLDEIKAKVEAGTLTKEEAQAEIEKLGVKFFGHRGGDFGGQTA